MTTVVHYRKDAYDIYIGRGSIWGNPFAFGKIGKAQFLVGTREEALAKYKDYVLSRPDLIAKLGELKGKRLACYCVPLRCHGNVLIELIEELNV